jgi:hypothetical protein
MFLYEDVFRAFQEQGVNYVIVGGIAVNLHGSLRSTADLDILVEMSDENLGKIVEILRDKGYRVMRPVDPMKITDKEIREDWVKNKHMKALNFYREGELEEVDIVIESTVGYDEAKESVIRVEIDDLTLPVIGIDQLIAMKQETGRAVDKLDVEELTKIKKLKANS